MSSSPRMAVVEVIREKLASPIEGSGMAVYLQLAHAEIRHIRAARDLEVLSYQHDAVALQAALAEATMLQKERDRLKELATNYPPPRHYMLTPESIRRAAMVLSEEEAAQSSPFVVRLTQGDAKRARMQDDDEVEFPARKCGRLDGQSSH